MQRKKLAQGLAQGLAIAAVAVVIGAQVVCVYNTNRQQSSIDTENDQEHQQLQVQDVIDIQVYEVPKVDVKSEYKKLDSLYDKRVKEYSKLEFTPEYRIGDIYDMNTEYLADAGFSKISQLEELGFNEYQIQITQAEVDDALNSIKELNQLEKYGDAHKVEPGDYVCVQIDQKVDGKRVAYIDGGYLQYNIGDGQQESEGQLIKGLDDLILGQSMGYSVKFTGEAPSNTVVSLIDTYGVTDTKLDISGQTVEFTATLVYVGKYTEVELTDDMVKPYGADTVDEYREKLIRGRAWELLEAYSTQVAYTAAQKKEISIPDSIVKQLNIVAQTVTEGFDCSGMVYEEFMRILVADVYNSIYETLPEQYKIEPTDSDKLRELLSERFQKDMADSDVGETKLKFPNEQQFMDYIRKLEVLKYYLDNTEVIPV